MLKPLMFGGVQPNTRTSTRSLHALLGEQCANSRSQAAIQVHARLSRAMAVQNHADRGAELGLKQFLRQLCDRHWITLTDRTSQNVFRNFEQPIQSRTAAGENQTRAEKLVHSGMPQMIAQHFHQFAATRL